nr:MAG TPA: 50S ribosomal subunit [Caudoviricetes sp.]
MNEQEAIEQLQNEYLVSLTGRDGVASVRYHNEALDTAIAALKEVQEYHAIGRTPDMVRGLIGGYNRVRKQCVELGKMLKKYEKLEKYVVLEVAAEKQMPKKVREIDGMLVCPYCETYVGVEGCLEHQYCPECGQKVSV